MKKYLFLLLVFVFCSCKSYKAYLSFKESHEINVQDSIVNGMFVYGKVDGNKLKFLFDTGATSSIVNDINLIGGKDILNKDNTLLNKKVRGADKEVFSVIAYKSKSFDLNSYKSENKFVLLFDKKIKPSCNDNIFNKDGVMGLDIFWNSEHPILLDYENSSIKIIHNSFDKTGFKELDVIMKNKQILLKSAVNNNKVDLLLDTGNTGYILLIKNTFNKPPDESFESFVKIANDKVKFQKQDYYRNEIVDIGGVNDHRNYITVYEGMKSNGVGLQFIKQYNWILDFKNKKVYAKKIDDYDPNLMFEIISKFKYKVSDFDGQLHIAYKKDKTNRFNIGDVIVSIDNVPITKSNICDMKTSMNSLADWSDLNIKTRSNTN